jgi:hypothetical protein
MTMWWALGMIGFCLLGSKLPTPVFIAGVIVMLLWGAAKLFGSGGPFDGPYQRS